MTRGPMFDQILKFFSAPDMSSGRSQDEGPRLAIAALLVEAAKSDGIYKDGERHVVAGLLNRLFTCGETEAVRLVAEAERALAQSVFFGSMAYTLIGGTAAGTVLILVFLPALYAIWFKVKRREAGGSAAPVGEHRGMAPAE